MNWAVFFLLAVLAAVLVPALAQARQYTFFKNTQYPLTVYFLKGERPGPTIMVQGGIQGDEPSGYLTAQLLTRAKIKKGNLIIVPRANVPSINVCKRQVNVDLNRRFDRDYNRFYEDRLARAIRFLIHQADGFIHLHEGSGFYSPVWESNLRNPKRYGQSIIIDTAVYADKIHLENMAREVLSEVNPGVLPDKWRFKLFNTMTFDQNTPYPQMRKSLTFYALRDAGIPALAVEVSKSITDRAWKVRQQLKVTMCLLAKFGIELDAPALTAMARQLDNRDAEVVINGKPFDTGVLKLDPGEFVSIGVGDKNPGLLDPCISVFASDRPDLNLAGGARMALSPFTRLEVRKDGRKIRTANVKFSGKWPDSGAAKTPVYVCWLNNRPNYVPNNEVLTAIAGDQLLMDGVWGSNRDEILNLKGYVTTPWSNDGQDMGMEIVLDPDNFMRKYMRYDSKKEQWFCTVARETPGGDGRFLIRILPRRIYALRLETSSGRPVVLPVDAGGQADLLPGKYVLADVWSNGDKDKVALMVNGFPVDLGQTIELKHGERVEVSFRQATTFGLLSKIELKSSNYAGLGAPGGG